MTTPLEGITVIDLSQGISGPLCSMYLGELGARVIKVEPIAGDWARGLEPRIGDQSALFLALNRNKESLALNWQNDQGREVVQRLAARADVFIFDRGDASAQELDLNYASLASRHPDLIYGAVTPFGEQGPWADLIGSELVVQAASGFPRYLGQPGQEPVRLGADVANTAAGIFLLQALLAALFYRQHAGSGQRVAVSQLGSLLALKTIQITAQHHPDTWEGYHCWGPYTPPDTGWQTQDRPIVFSFGEFTGGGRDKKSQWPEFCEKLGLAHLWSDERFQKDGANSTGLGADAAKFRALYEQAFRHHRADELIALIRQLGGAAYPYHTYEALFADPQTQTLGILRDVLGPQGVIGAIKAPWNFSESNVDIRRPPPELGASTGAILAEIGYSAPQQRRLFHERVVGGKGPAETPGESNADLRVGGNRRQGPLLDQGDHERRRPQSNPQAVHSRVAATHGPLHGIRIMDISAVGVGPATGLILAELGAEVVKVEPPGGELGHAVLPKQRGTSVLYISVNLGKRGIILDFKDAKALDTAYRLVERCDIVIENFRVGVVERLGLGYEALARVNPRLIYCSLSGFGRAGPLAQLPSIDTYIQAFSGFASLNGPPGSAGESLRAIGFMDLFTSAVAVPAILAALLARESRGRGEYISVSMLEAAMTLQLTRLAEYLATGKSPPPQGSGVAYAVPDQAFQVLDGYLALSAHTPQEWERLCRALGQMALRDDPRFRSVANRIANRAALAERLAAILRAYPSGWWLKVLGEAGVPCGRFYRYDELCQHVHVLKNQLMVELDTPDWGRIRVGGLPWSFSRTPGVIRPGPTPGRDTETILADLVRAHCDA
jgi:crotonobetainyl-CoA:carnitine CoA-transferase CaiB-like acyl-CoA transferase